jgi:hypothetical protein
MNNKQKSDLTITVNQKEPGTVTSIRGVAVPDGMLSTSDNLPRESLKLTEEAIDLATKMFSWAAEKRVMER